jgi:hypothetical protein
MYRKNLALNSSEAGYCGAHRKLLTTVVSTEVYSVLQMAESKIMLFAQSVTENRVRRFVLLMAFWTVVYWLGEYAFYFVVGWAPRGWGHALLWGVLMALLYTFWPPGKQRTTST